MRCDHKVKALKELGSSGLGNGDRSSGLDVVSRHCGLTAKSDSLIVANSGEHLWTDGHVNLKWLVVGRPGFSL